MMEIKVTCDTCSMDLSDAGPSPDYRLELSPQKIPNSGGIMLAVIPHKPIERTMHFCSIACLSEWLDSKAGLRRAQEGQYATEECEICGTIPLGCHSFHPKK